MEKSEDINIQDLNAKRVQSYLSSFASGQPSEVAKNVHPDFQNRHMSVLGKSCDGKGDYEKRLVDFLGHFEGLKYALISLVVEENSAACKYLMSFQISGKDFEIPGMMWFDFVDGLIFRRVDCWDGLTYLKQSETMSAEIAALLE